MIIQDKLTCVCVCTDDSDQLGHLSSPISVFVVSSMDGYYPNVCSFLLRSAITDHTERMIRLI